MPPVLAKSSTLRALGIDELRDRLHFLLISIPPRLIPLDRDLGNLTKTTITAGMWCLRDLETKRPDLIMTSRISCFCCYLSTNGFPGRAFSRFHDRGSCYRRADIDKNGLLGFGSRNELFWSPHGIRDRSNEHELDWTGLERKTEQGWVAWIDGRLSLFIPLERKRQND